MINPTQPAPVDLDTILSPLGPYETGPDAAIADGAQLLTDRHGGNPTWWAPQLEFDSLDALLDLIRARLLPHLRPPVVGIDVPGPDGDYGDLADLCAAEQVPAAVGVPLLRRAAAAWGRTPAQPPAEGEVGQPTHQRLLEIACSREPWATWLQAGGCLESAHFELVDLFRAVLACCGTATPQPPPRGDVARPTDAELIDLAEQYYGEPVASIRAALARWSTATPQPPAGGEVAEFVAWIRQQGVHSESGAEWHRAADLLERLAPLQPILDALVAAESALADIAEGEPEDPEMDFAQLQWAERRAADALELIRPVMQQHQAATSEWPTHALPLPSGEGEG